MKVLKTIMLFILIGNSLYAFADQSYLCEIPIIEAPGETMPELEKQVMEIYRDEEGPLPVVFKGAAKNWEAASWTPEYFAEHFAEKEIVVMPQDLLDFAAEPVLKAIEEGKLFNADEDPSFRIQTTIKDHIADILLNPKNAGYFIGGLKGDDENGIFVYENLNLSTQVQFPQLERNLSGYNLLIGSGYSVSSLHNHRSTFLSQIYGKKIAKLVHPKNADNCSCIERETGKYADYCLIDISDLEIDDFQHMEIYQTILEPGDVLYIPDGWLHDIRALSTSISIAYGF